MAVTAIAITAEASNCPCLLEFQDWGFVQESYTEEELKEESAASSSRDPPPIKNPFILTSVSSVKSQKKGENLIIIDQSKPSSLKFWLYCLVNWNYSCAFVNIKHSANLVLL